MQRITMYEVMANSDTTEGKGYTYSTGIAFISLKDALSFVQSKHYEKYAAMGCVEPVGGETSPNIREVTYTIFADQVDFAENFASHECEKKLSEIYWKLGVADVQFLKELLGSGKEN